MFNSFNVQSVSASSSASVVFEHGCEYPARILGLWSATKTYQEQVKHGMGILVAIADENNKVVYRGLFMSLDGYVLGARATYCKIMQGLLRCSDTDAALQDRIVHAGLADISALVGRPCLARMSIKENAGKSWANLESIAGETSRSKGLTVDAGALPEVDVRKVFGKFIDIKDLKDCVYSEGLKIADPDAASHVEDGLDTIVDNALF